MNNLFFIMYGINNQSRTFKIVLLRIMQIELHITQMTATHISLGFRLLKWEFDPTFRMYKNWLIDLPKEV